MTIWNEEALFAALPAALLAVSLAGAGCRDAFAGPPRDYDRSASSAAASATALPVEPEVKLIDGHKPWAPTLDAAVPEVASDPPTKEEWASAVVAREARVTDSFCHVHRVREWYRVACTSGASVEMISGGREGVSFGCPKSTRDTVICDEAWVVFPARRGDRRAIEVFNFFKWGPEPDVVVTEQFLEGDPCPLISVQGIRWGF